MSTLDKSAKFNKKIIPHVPDNQMGEVENLTEFTKALKKLDESEKIIVAILVENRSENGTSADWILDILQSDPEIKLKYSNINLEMIENTLIKIGTRSVRNETNFMLNEQQKNIARSVIGYNSVKIHQIIVNYFTGDLCEEDETEEL